jgi:hypothetical protein
MKVAERRSYRKRAGAALSMEWHRSQFVFANALPRTSSFPYIKNTDEQERAFVSSKPRSRTKSRVTKGTRPKLAPTAAAKRHADELLDEALDQTFPASDPPFITRDTDAT